MSHPSREGDGIRQECAKHGPGGDWVHAVFIVLAATPGKLLVPFR
jgi:hypothetical protein